MWRQRLIGVLCFCSFWAIHATGPAFAQSAPRGGSDERVANPSGDATVRFSFAGEEWLGVLQWFADTARMNLDWHELPEGTLNLTTQHDYSIPEALDVINLHLLARGFTLLRRGDVLFVVKLDDDLNPALVPRVAPEDLDERGRYEYCKVSFPLDWMLAKTAVEELKPMLSAYGQITPLTATNRIEVMDAAVNLMELRELLMREQSDTSQQRLVAEFVLEHATALEVLDKLHQILGLETPLARMSEDQMETVQEQYQLRSRMLEELGERAPPMKRMDAEVYLVANERKNSILANAAPDKIAVIRQAIESLDVPSREGVSLGDVTTMKVYPLNGADAEAVAEILEELRDIGKLHPSSRFSEDDDRQILFAYASIQDHLTIASVMKQLSGSARTFRVIPLRNLKAAYVAESIRTLMGAAGEAEAPAGRDRWRRRRTNDENTWRGFRAEADPPNNRLLLFATDAELEQVEELLVKIGERSAGMGERSNDRIRVVDVSVDEADQAFDQLRALWPSFGSNPLHIDIPGYREEAADSSLPRASAARADELDRGAAAGGVETGRGAAASGTIPPRLRSLAPAATAEGLFFASLAHLREEGTESGGQADGDVPPDDARRASGEPFRAPEGPPVTIRQGLEGELILSSDDTAALDQLEYLVRELLPQRRPNTVFFLQHASPYTVQLTLEEIFANDPVRATSPINFVSDFLTKSIRVFGAGTSELREIEELIEFYDQSQESNPQSVRKPRFFDLEHAQAESVANVLKDIYRDLLSANDRALAQSRDEDSRNGSETTYFPGAAAAELAPRFKGMLSIGVVPESNALIVSAPAFLADEIAETIQKLDRPTPPPVTRVVAIDGGVNPALIAQHLTNLVAPPSPATATDPRDRDERSEENRRGNGRQDDSRGEGSEKLEAVEEIGRSERSYRFGRDDGDRGERSFRSEGTTNDGASRSRRGASDE
jgi:type II secretory pathway component GspD/PulD (secretin)